MKSSSQRFCTVPQPFSPCITFFEARTYAPLCIRCRHMAASKAAHIALFVLFVRLIVTFSLTESTQPYFPFPVAFTFSTCTSDQNVTIVIRNYWHGVTIVYNHLRTAKLNSSFYLFQLLVFLLSSTALLFLKKSLSSFRAFFRLEGGESVSNFHGI